MIGFCKISDNFEKQIHMMSDRSLTRDRPVSLWEYNVFLTKKERVWFVR